MHKDGKVNGQLIEQKFNDLPDNQYIKFEIFQKGILSFEGHSMVIKKTGDSFSFFDPPNEGEFPNLTISDLTEKINNAMKTYGGTSMCFLDANPFINSLKIKSDKQNEEARYIRKTII